MSASLLVLLSFLVVANSFTALFATPSRYLLSHGHKVAPLRANARHHVGAAIDKDKDDVLWSMTSFFSEMVDESSGRFYYLCFPPCGEKQHAFMPIRDLAAIWDATKALRFWQDNQLPPQREEQRFAVCDRLSDAVRRSLRAYNSSYMSLADGVALDPEILMETPNIAHSAVMILALTGSLRLGDKIEMAPIDALTRGILSAQLPNGAFCADFSGSLDGVYIGIEFFPGEAMLALMEVHELSGTMRGIVVDETRNAIIPGMMKAFKFYSEFYYEGNVDTNYNIWQVQAFARLYDALSAQSGGKEEMDSLRAYVLDLCDGIIDSRSWKYELSRGQSFYQNLETVEIACGLDSLADGIRVAYATDDTAAKAQRLDINIKNAMAFLQWAQRQVPVDSPAGYGGLGFGGINVLEQRIDVTGHAISAFTKML